MNTTHESSINGMVNAFGLERAVNAGWITIEQSELIRLGYLIESIARQITELTAFMPYELAVKAVWDYHNATVFRGSADMTIKLVSESVSRILKDSRAAS